MVYISSFGVELFLNLMRENRALEPRTKIVLKADLSQKILPSDYGVKESGRQKRKEEEEKEEEKKNRSRIHPYVFGGGVNGLEEKLMFNVAFISFSVYFSRHFFSSRVPPLGKTFVFLSFPIMYVLILATAADDDDVAASTVASLFQQDVLKQC